MGSPRLAIKRRLTRAKSRKAKLQEKVGMLNDELESNMCLSKHSLRELLINEIRHLDVFISDLYSQLRNSKKPF